MRQNDFRSAAPAWAALSPLVLWLAAIAAYAYEDGMNLFQWMGRFSQVLERPFSIGWTPYTLKYMLGSLLLYGCGIALYYSSRENRRPGEEYGSAKWGNPKELNRKYMDHQHKDANIILTQRVRLGMDGYITQRNMNVLVVGGSGSGKTRFFCKPNIYSANCSYLITDPKGELLRAAGALLAAQGYEVRVFNLIDPSQSDGYNPFSYIHSEKDVLTLIDNLIKNTTPRNASSNDPFWEKAEIALDSALMLYLVSEAPPEEQNFEMLIYMMNFAEVREEDDQYRSPLDMLFRALEEEQPNHVAVKQYKAFKQAAGKTAKSILVSAAVRLATFNIPQYARMTMVDEMDFGSLGEKKKAIFCVIPVDDSSMNYLVGMLYTQCFQALYRRADEKHNGRLPVPVRVIQDEWANVAQPESYPKILATCRSYNIGLNIIVQNIQQIKALYEKEWESIIGNCDTLLFLGGGNEPTSLEFIVKLLGKETIATRTRGQTKGRSGSSSTNFQQTGRDLMTIDEVRKLDTHKAILFIRGEDPVLDKKYNIKRHPNIKLTTDGKAKPYIHKPQGAPDYALPDLPYAFKSLDDYDFIDMEEPKHESEQEEPLETVGAEYGEAALLDGGWCCCSLSLLRHARDGGGRRSAGHCKQSFRFYLQHHQGAGRHYSRLGYCAGGYVDPVPRCQPENAGLPLPVWWLNDRLCKGNSDRHRRNLMKRAGRYCLAADLPAPLWEVIFIWITTGS